MLQAVHRYLDGTFRDKAFYHMISIQAALLLALCWWLGIVSVGKTLYFTTESFIEVEIPHIP